MSAFDLAELPELLARLDCLEGLPRVSAGRKRQAKECASAIRALMDARDAARQVRDAAVAAEREACAKVCDDVSDLYRSERDYDMGATHALEHAAQEIRGRGAP